MAPPTPDIETCFHPKPKICKYSPGCRPDAFRVFTCIHERLPDLDEVLPALAGTKDRDVTGSVARKYPDKPGWRTAGPEPEEDR